MRAAVQAILTDPRYAAASRRLGEEIAASPGPEGLLDDIDAMLARVRSRRR